MNRPFKTLALTGLFATASATAQITQDERDVLEAFYEAANGDEWHRNDGWLQPDSDPCGWYGVTCTFRGDIGRDMLLSLALPGNNLSGALDTRVFEILHDRLDLSDNRLGGTLERRPASPGRVDLSNNRLSGELPTESTGVTDYFTGGPPSGNWYLDLSRNGFEGEVPPNWGGINWLSLANNRLEGMPLSLVDGSNVAYARFYDLSDNRFSGELPTSLMEGNFKEHNGSSRWGGGLNLCWNDWTIPDSEAFRDWLRNHHVGGEFDSCLSRQRQAIDPMISGSWYDPARVGEGVVLQALDNGTVLNYFFTFDEHGQQQWLVGTQTPEEHSVSWRELLRTRGQFGSGLSQDDPDATEVRGSFRIDRLGADRLVAERVYIDERFNACVLPYPPPLGCFGDSLSDRLEYRQLSQLAATTCDKQSPFQHHAGAWYNPERSGEGFIIEVLPGDRAIVYWFTYTPDASGDQAWMVGEGFVGSFDAVVGTPPPGGQPESRIEIESLWQPVGTAFGPEFDAAEVELVDWGSLIVDFYSDGSGRIAWNSEIQGYGSGEYPIERLARPMLADCGSGENTESPFPIESSGNLDDAPGRYKELPLTLTDNGQPQITPADDRIGMVCIGMSNAYQECEKLVQGIEQVWSDEVNNQIELVNCALGGHAIERWNDPAFDAVLWAACEDEIAQQGLGLDQVRVVLHKAANQFTTDDDGQPLPPYPSPDSDYFRFKDNLDIFSERVTGFFPALQAVFTTSRSYGGFSTRPARGEPIGYEEGHALNQWLAANGLVNQVWFGWGPYIWAPVCDRGITNGFGVCYVRDDFEADGIHPSNQGEIKIATMWHERLLEFDWYSTSQPSEKTAASPR